MKRFVIWLQLSQAETRPILRMRQLILVPIIVLSSASALASIYIEPVYNYKKEWTGKAKVTYYNDGKSLVKVKYPVFNGCSEAIDTMSSAKASNPKKGGFLGFGYSEKMTRTEVNQLIRKLENNLPLHMEDYARSSMVRAGTVYAYPSAPFDCGPNPITQLFPRWR